MTENFDKLITKFAPSLFRKRHLVFENVEVEKKFLIDNGYQWIDEVQMGNYLLFLSKSVEGEYEIGITSFDSAFTTLQSQEKQPAKDSLHRYLGIIQNTISIWLKKYKMLFVGSFNKSRVFLYHRMFSKFFKCSDISYTPPIHGLPESWNFQLGIPESGEGEDD